MNVSRQSISKYEQGTTYPEIEKLKILSRKFNIIIDSLLNGDESNTLTGGNIDGKIEKNNENLSIQKIFIKNYDGQNLNSYYEFYISTVFKPTEKQPQCTLMGTYKDTFWGKSSSLLGYYASKEDALKEIDDIQKALNSGATTYELKYYSKVNKNFIDIELDI